MINLFSGIKTREYISHFLIISMVFVACFFFGPTRLYADPPGPNLSVSPTTLTVGIDPNYSTSMVPNYSRVLVSNTGAGALNWTAQVTSGADWLQIRSGASGTNSGEVNVGFLSNTSVAARTGAIRITASGASGSPVDISVNQVGHLPMTIRVPDTGQTLCYDTPGNIITCPSPGQALYGQDGNYSINPMSFTKLDAHGNDLPDSATTWYMVRDNVTRLIWEMKNNKDGKADYSNPTMQTMNTPGTTATRLPTAAMPEHKVLVRIPNPFLKL